MLVLLLLLLRLRSAAGVGAATSVGEWSVRKGKGSMDGRTDVTRRVIGMVVVTIVVVVVPMDRAAYRGILHRWSNILMMMIIMIIYEQQSMEYRSVGERLMR